MLKQRINQSWVLGNKTAAFGRLCVETTLPTFTRCVTCQPPSGGCVLKPVIWPPPLLTVGQPPSGGCVLKPPIFMNTPLIPKTAAFGRLCVETQPSEATLQPLPLSRLRAAVC